MNPKILYIFNKNGLIEKIKNNGLGVSSMELSIDKEKLKWIHIFHGTYGDKDQSTIIEPIEYDDIGRAIKIRSRRIKKNGTTETINPIEITSIRYDNNRQEHKTYAKEMGHIKLVNEKIIEFHESGFVKKICSTWNAGPACESGDTMEFSIDGPINIESTLGRRTKFIYESGFLSEEISVNKAQEEVSRIYFDYIIDECGNWTERKIRSSGTKHAVEKREIKYFNQCNNS